MMVVVLAVAVGCLGEPLAEYDEGKVTDPPLGPRKASATVKRALAKGLWCLAGAVGADSAWARCDNQDDMCCYWAREEYKFPASSSDATEHIFHVTTTGGCTRCVNASVIGPHPDMPLGAMPYCVSYKRERVDIRRFNTPNPGVIHGTGSTCICKGSECNRFYNADKPKEAGDPRAFIADACDFFLQINYDQKKAQEMSADRRMGGQAGRCRLMSPAYIPTKQTPPATVACRQSCCLMAMDVNRTNTVEAGCGGRACNRFFAMWGNYIPKGRNYICALQKPDALNDKLSVADPPRLKMLCYCTGYLCNRDIPSAFNAFPVEEEPGEGLDTFIHESKYARFPDPTRAEGFICADTAWSIDPASNKLHDPDSAANRENSARNRLQSRRFYTMCEDCCWAYKLKPRKVKAKNKAKVKAAGRKCRERAELVFPAGCHPCLKNIDVKFGHEVSEELLWTEDPEYEQKGSGHFPWLHLDAAQADVYQYYVGRCKGRDYCNEKPMGGLNFTKTAQLVKPLTYPRVTPRQQNPNKTFPPLPPPYDISPLIWLQSPDADSAAAPARLADLFVAFVLCYMLS